MELRSELSFAVSGEFESSSSAVEAPFWSLMKVVSIEKVSEGGVEK